MPFLRLLSSTAVLFILGGLSTVTAQVTELTSQDLLNLVGVNQAAQVFETPQALDPSQNAALQAVVSATGTGQVYDFRSFDFNFVGQGLIRYRTIAQAQSLGWPGQTIRICRRPTMPLP